MRSGTHRIGLLVFDGIRLLDLAGPTEVFNEANRLGADYRISMVSIDGRDVRTSMGMRIPVDQAASASTRFDTILVTGSEAFPADDVTDALASAAAGMSLCAARTASICTGAFVLAAAGLLEGKKATTHWHYARELAQRYPGIHVELDAIVVKDGTTYSSAGVTAGIDLALLLLEEDEGTDAARSVARSLVVHLRRDGGQAQFSDSLVIQLGAESLLRGVVDTILADPSAEYTAASMAAIARVSPRHLSRLFRDELETTPSKYLELARIDRAKLLLASGLSVTRAAEDSGFGTSESLRRAFISHLSVPPSSYRRRFSSSPGHTSSRTPPMRSPAVVSAGYDAR